MTLEVREGLPGDAALWPEGEAWAWELANPLGARVRVATVDGRPVARFATRRQRVLADGEPRVFACVLPTWTASGVPGGAQDEGLQAAARRLIQDTAGWDDDALAYGWLPAEVFLWCGRDLRFEILRVHTVLAAEVGEGERTLPGGVEELARLDGRVAELQARVAVAHGVSGMRDEDWLAWRVAAHPERPYRALAVRGADGALAGLALLRSSSLLGGRALSLVDWLVPEDEPEVGDALLAGARALARDLGERELRASFPEWSRWFERFQERGFLVGPSRLRLATRKNHPRHEIYWLRDNWWMQPLDFSGV